MRNSGTVFVFVFLEPYTNRQMDPQRRPSFATGGNQAGDREIGLARSGFNTHLDCHRLDILAGGP